jgi:hypothetical protein
MSATVPELISLHQEILHGDFSYISPNEHNNSLLFTVTRKLVWARGNAKHRSSMGSAHTLLHHHSSPSAPQLYMEDFIVTSVFICIVQDSYSQPYGGFFFNNIYCLQTLKEHASFYLYTTVKTVLKIENI